jgi:acyl carrier protein
MEATLRRLISECVHLDLPIDDLSNDANLYEAGLQSLATVKLMIAIEDAFGIELPDHLLTRQTFSSIDSLAAAIRTMRK